MRSAAQRVGRKRPVVVIAARVVREHPVLMDRRIVIAVFPGIQALDLVGPLEVFHAAHRHLGSGRGYRVEVVAESTDVLQTSSGLQLLADRSFSSVRGAIDTLVIAGGEGARAAAHERLSLIHI